MSEALPFSPSPFEIVELDPTDEIRLHEAAQTLHEAMAPASSAWPTPDAALGDLIEQARIRDAALFVALDGAGAVVGVGGVRPRYVGHVMEIFCLAVRPAAQRRGAGRALLRALESAAARRGCGSLMIGLNDEAGLTALAGAELYPDPLEHLDKLADAGGHPVGFFRRMGYHVVGLIPEAHGPGQPEILMIRKLRE